MNEVSASSSIENILLKLEEHAAACDQRFEILPNILTDFGVV